jgi:RimJ/RimL family protein N-acetyltransferase
VLATQIARPPETGVNLAVELRATGELIGHVSLTIGEHRQGELGFVFHPGHQGRGYATEAAHALLAREWRRANLTAGSL